MKNHIKNYLDRWSYGVQDIIMCEKCPAVAVDIYHKKLKSQGEINEFTNN